MRPITKRRLTFLGAFALYFTVLWFFWQTPVVYPLKVFVVLLHEISHGVVAVATGGTIRQIVLDPAQGGACFCPGGSAFLTLSAGYLGSLAWGALLLVAAQDAPKRWTPRLTGIIGGIVMALTVVFVRGWFGIAFGLTFGAALVLSSVRLSVGFNRIVLTALGLTSCLYAILDIKSDILERPELRSDARMLAELTGVPTELWGFVWIGVALVVSALLFKRMYRRA